MDNKSQRRCRKSQTPVETEGRPKTNWRFLRLAILTNNCDGHGHVQFSIRGGNIFKIKTTKKEKACDAKTLVYIRGQERDFLFCTATAFVSHTNRKYNINTEKLLIQRSSVDSALKNVAILSLQKCITNISNCSSLSGLAYQRQKFENLCHNFHWSYIAAGRITLSENVLVALETAPSTVIRLSVGFYLNLDHPTLSQWI